MPPTPKQPAHYYGDIVRAVFLIIAVTMLLMLTTAAAKLGVPVSIGIFSIIILGVAAGITNPVQRASMLLNTVISFFGLLVFAYMSWFMKATNANGALAFFNQAIAVLFLIALYLSIKTYRGAVLGER